MTSMLISLIAIVLFAVVITSAFLYFDADEARAIGDAPLMVSKLGNLVEAAEAFRQARGNYPLDMADLRTEFEMEELGGLDVRYVISDGVVCLSLPYKKEADDVLQIASRKFSGAVVTDGTRCSPGCGIRALGVLYHSRRHDPRHRPPSQGLQPDGIGTAADAARSSRPASNPHPVQDLSR